MPINRGDIAPWTRPPNPNPSTSLSTPSAICHRRRSKVFAFWCKSYFRLHRFRTSNTSVVFSSSAIGKWLRRSTPWLSRGGSRGYTYTPSAQPATATAVPVEQDDLFKCFVLLEESLVRPLAPTEYHVNPTTSALLEELLHVRVYSGLWEHLRPGRTHCLSTVGRVRSCSA